ncbi:carboxymuconolactone decarboxylase family protein [Natronorubrum daqingense]|uniref:Alkylhydroperoxidase n=1 Tax=Natronorubrum daqingense TaxID=588898 RepID=A0A1N6YI34_9EURY|nr:carboxymuconolactone decarboxylase family protein [Natronorubrum daqingense]APX95662.1 alkylhydroperoxidase [Natronorubrum daqingense]SIR14141.1 alkylhydroperoxidase AhpD family core domain-containing protein [Natronorubrum daqingense]
MVSTEIQEEIEAYLGTVPSWIESLPEPAADHSWKLVRDLQLEETELSAREKALVGLGAASATQCPYCVHFHRAEASLEDVTDEELQEAVNIAGEVRYFSSVLHGSEIEYDAFVSETAEMVEHIETQQAAMSGSD